MLISVRFGVFPMFTAAFSDPNEVQQILDRFRCHHKGCGQKLDQHQNVKKPLAADQLKHVETIGVLDS